MPISRKKRRPYIILTLLLILAALGPFVRTQWQQAQDVKAISTLRAISFLIPEYEDTHHTLPGDLTVIIHTFDSPALHNEFKRLLAAIDRGEVDYQPKPPPGQPMIRWRLARGTIHLHPDGEVNMIRHTAR
ncbi:hypothetical protein JIN84_05600 [Luteolibacter yonseiensis]|uniref:Uncharacterized protein n=1 Tax=Luteolibacter yonseiensis TaxID=1144680 RepID=A0A934VAE6_9BACT|nr:hypothetical protein [Luteolibacter yonseiensis]MBK1815075.1 hypothetical protein [Luteolibacter yonseiensis]